MTEDELTKAYALYELGRLDDAEHRARALLAVTPGEPDTVNLLGLVALCRERWHQLDELGRELMRVAPESARGPMYRAIALANQQQIEQAVEFGRAAARLAPDDPVVVGQLAEILVAAGAGDDAEATIRRALELAPGKAQLHRLHAVVLVALGRLDDALAAAQEAVALDPMHADSHLRLGDVLLRQGNPAVAEQEFMAALRQDPSAENLEAVLRSLADAGIPSQLEPLLGKIAAAMGLSMPEDVSVIRADLACLMRDKERYEEAYALATSLLRNGFHDVRAYSASIVSAWHLERYGDGLTLARDARAHIPETPQILWLESLFLLALGRYTESAEVATRYVTLAPDAADGYTVLGRALLDSGRKAEAAAALTEGLRLDPNDAQTQEYLAEALG